MKTYLTPYKVSYHLLPAADCLVPASFGAVGIVLGDSAAAGCRHAEATDGGVRGIVFCLGFILLVFTLALVGIGASDAAEDGLGGAANVVDDRLEGRGVLVRHGCGWLCRCLSRV